MKNFNYEDNNFLDIIDESKSYEDNIRSVWHRNVFFILGYGLIYLYFFIFALCNRIKRFIKYIICKCKKENYTYIRKISQRKWIKIHNDIVDSNFWRTMWFMMLFLSLGIGKLIYHLFNIISWICKYIIVPIVKWLTILFAIVSISGAISNKNNNNHY